jgi:hypothetical protein
MATPPKSELSANQKSMLDLALGCDLRISDPSQHAAIRSRHAAITTNVAAANYIREVENRIHSRRKIKSLKPKTAGVVAPTLTKPVPTQPVVSGAQATAAIFTLIVFMVVAGWFATGGLNLVLVTICMVLMLMVLRIAITKDPLGILINDRNLMSLSRFQMAIWTVIVLGAYFTFAVARIKLYAEGAANGQTIADPLNITIDWHLWALIGISTTSLVGAPLILSTKKDKQPAPSVAEKTAQAVNEPAQEIDANRQGTLYANAKMSDARITDMFQGDELTNTAQIDLAKVQMFYFTIIAAVCFFVMVFKQLVTHNASLDTLPLLPDGLIAVLGISHGGYLTSKSINHTKSQS